VGGRDVARRAPPVAECREMRGEMATGNPVQQIDHRPAPLPPPPPVEAWLATRGAAWSA
jgi:hypothetical protein